MFITFDGIDGAGKSSQIAILKDRLQQRTPSTQITLVRDPGSTAAGEAIRGLLLDSNLHMHRRCEALLYMAARAQLCEERIRPALATGQHVISDRFLLANVVYQSAGGGEDPEVLWRLGEIAIGGLRPDLTILLDLPVEIAVARIRRRADRIESRGDDYFRLVREGFLQHVPRAGRAYSIIDANQSQEQVSAEIWSVVADRIGIPSDPSER